jgi:hypothetical protein
VVALIQATELANLIIEAHSLLEQFALEVNARPKLAWVRLLDLRRLLGQLQETYPPSTFRPAPHVSHPSSLIQGTGFR